MKRIFFVLGVFLILIFVAALVFLKVRSIKCQVDNRDNCPNSLLQKLHAYEGARIFQTEKKIRQMLSQESQVQSYSVKTSPLGDILVDIALRDGSIALKPETASVYTLYTKDGVVVKDSSETTLPVVTLKEQVATNALPFIATLSYELTKILPVAQITVEGESLKVLLRDNRLVYYPLAGDIDLLLGSTLITFSQLNLTDGKLIIDRQAVVIREIDLRFKNPVLR